MCILVSKNRRESTMPTTDEGHFFAKYFFILETRFDSFKFNFLGFQQLRNKYAKYILCCAFVVATQ
jgi:hypothetical protein